MESVQNIRTYEYFEVSDADFEIFQNIWAKHDTHNADYAVTEVEMSDAKFSRPKKYTDDEIKSIFMLHAEYTGIDKEIAKNNVVDLSDRRKAEEELKVYIKSSASKRNPLSLKSAKILLKVVEAFESYECEIK